MCSCDIAHLIKHTPEKDATSGRQYLNSPTNVRKLRTLALLSFSLHLVSVRVSTNLQSDPPTMRAVEPTFHATSTRTEDSYAPEDDLEQSKRGKASTA